MLHAPGKCPSLRRVVHRGPRHVTVVGHPAPMDADANPWHHLAEQQQGVVGRSQLLSLGLSRSQARGNVANGRWRLLLPGVYATFTGPVGDLAAVWAAILGAGSGAAASHATALWLGGVIDDRPGLIHVSIPAERRVRSHTGVRIHRARSGSHSVHPAASPPRSRVECAVLDASETASPVVVVDLVLRAIQRRLTTTSRLREALSSRSRHRHRSLLAEVMEEAEAGVHSMLERRYLRDVESRHRLPSGRRNQAERGADGSNRYRVVRYRQWLTVVELDGRAGHPADEVFRDHRRDNAAVVAGDVVLRYGWRDVVRNPCRIAAEVAAVLQGRGWPGVPSPCGPGCCLR